MGLIARLLIIYKTFDPFCNLRWHQQVILAMISIKPWKLNFLCYLIILIIPEKNKIIDKWYNILLGLNSIDLWIAMQMTRNMKDRLQGLDVWCFVSKSLLKDQNYNYILQDIFTLILPTLWIKCLKFHIACS